MENTSKDLEKSEASEITGPSSTETTTNEVLDLNEDLEAGLAETDEEHVQVECRICQEEDFMDKLEAPCLCNGTLKVYISRYIYLFCLFGQICLLITIEFECVTFFVLKKTCQ